MFIILYMIIELAQTSKVIGPVMFKVIMLTKKNYLRGRAVQVRWRVATTVQGGAVAVPGVSA